MEYPLEDQHKPADLPTPELNPLMNPTLGKNLGRWAQVYFTNPPEAREQAVLELLRELERNPDSGLSNSRRQDNLCPRCQEPNPDGQKFCGFCGTTLGQRETPTSASPGGLTQSPTANFETQSFENDEREVDEIQWLRERAARPHAEPVSSRKPWLFAAAVALVTLLAIGAILHRSPSTGPKPEPNSRMDMSVSATAIKPAEAQTTSMTSQNHRNGKVSRTDESVRMDNRHEHGVTLAAEVSPAALPSQEAELSGAGALEYAEAKRLLEGAERDPAQAAHLLWKSVKKQNVEAGIALADLYARGDGVDKNCEQSRLLLAAALKKNTAEAESRLHSIESSCQ